MASSDFDQRFLGRIAKQTEESNPLLSASLYQILGLSMLLSKRLVRARKLRKLDTTRDTPSLAAYQHILWLSREGLSILELYVLPYAQDGQHGPECRVLSVKLRASFYHIFCLFHNQPPVTATNLDSNEGRSRYGILPLPLFLRDDNDQVRKADNSSGLSPPSKKAGKQPSLREPIDSITSETSFLTNPYAAGGPVGTPSPGALIAPPGLNPVPIPQPSSFLLPPLNFIPLAGGFFTTASAYATAFLPGSHPLRLSVALEHCAFIWDCVHDHEGSRRLARRAIKDVYRAEEAMDDVDFEDAADLVRTLGMMMKRKSWEGTPRVGGPSPGPVDGPIDGPIDGPVDQAQGGANTGNRGPPISNDNHVQTQQPSPRVARSAAEQPHQQRPEPDSPSRRPATRSRSNTATQVAHKKQASTGSTYDSPPKIKIQHASSDSQKTPPREARETWEVHFDRTAGSHSQQTTPRIRHASTETASSIASRPQKVPVSPVRYPSASSTIRQVHESPGSGSEKQRSPVLPDRSVSPSAAATLASDAMRASPGRASPGLRRSPPLRASPVQDNVYGRPREVQGK